MRWGRTSCPGTATEVYQGRAAAPPYGNAGGGSEYLCLPDNPKYLQHTDGAQKVRSRVVGVEYEMQQNPPALQHLNEANAPCVVCEARGRTSVLEIPATTECPAGWTREYYGYLVSEYSHPEVSYQHRMSFECLDADAEKIAGLDANTNPSFFYFTESSCHGLKCPPYMDGWELSCAVCTK